MLSSEANAIIWMQCFHLGLNVIMWDAMLSSGANVIIWDEMISSGANVTMFQSEANVIIWCYHVMLSSGMITSSFFIFPENFPHSWVSGPVLALEGPVESHDGGLENKEHRI
jgi:hypothetical protein